MSVIAREPPLGFLALLRADSTRGSAMDCNCDNHSSASFEE